ncbi:hypothetical protein HPP92_000758 [Vanilla planifolia]|uniref:DUF4378 domain-containing protein n=1 Tax=Vanilla planifolia TaxID=51239 RepID=A0A835S6D3_VANPL|nr:hypothetical protein HPP92_000758 [Vanilla planifolia]
MASPKHAFSHGRRLFELLEEKQEPFLPEVMDFKKRRGDGLLGCLLPSFIRRALNWESKALGNGRRCVLSCCHGFGRDARYGGYRRRMEPEELSPVQNQLAKEEKPSTSTCFCNQRSSNDWLLLKYGTELEKRIWVFCWEKQRRDAAKIEQMVDLELSGAKTQCKNFQVEAREVATAMEEVIFEEMREEVILEMLFRF